MRCPTKAKFVGEYSFTHSSFRRYVMVVIQLHTHATLFPPQEPPAPFEYEFDWTSEQIEMIWNFEVIMFLHYKVRGN